MYIEKAGTGTWDMVERCRAYGLETPKFQQDEDFRVVIYRPNKGEEQDSGTAAQVSVQDSAQVRIQVSAQARGILELCKQPATLSEIGRQLSMSNRGYIKRKFLAPLLEAGLLAMTIPEKPTSSQQKYRTTEKGLQFLVQEKDYD